MTAPKPGVDGPSLADFLRENQEFQRDHPQVFPVLRVSDETLWVTAIAPATFDADGKCVDAGVRVSSRRDEE